MASETIDFNCYSIARRLLPMMWDQRTKVIVSLSITIFMMLPQMTLAIGDVKSYDGEIGSRDSSRIEVITGEWYTRKEMPTQRSGHLVETYNNMLFAIGGHTGSDQATVNEVYFPSNDTWVTKQPMITKRAGIASAIVGDLIYAIGGDGGTGPACQAARR